MSAPDRETSSASEPRVIAAGAEHLPEIAAIYAAVVTGSPATFDIDPPGLPYWERILAACDPARGHLLLAAIDPAGGVLGYAKSGQFKERAAYWTTCETSIYVAESARGRRVGSLLYSRLLEQLEASPLRMAAAGVAEPNPASTALHLAFGFEPVGTFHRVGEKFDRLWDVTWYERSLG